MISYGGHASCGRHLIALTLAALTLSGCIKDKSAEAFATAQRRNLTPAEKTALTKALSQALKDPRSAQFKWMPVILITRNGIIDYCGLVNSRGYVGPFYAQLVAGGPTLSTGAIKAFDDGSPGLATSFCNTYGYTNLAQAE
jgi:hypothetical protein